MLRKYLLLSIIGMLTLLAGCDSTDSGDNETTEVNAVFTMTNDANSNEVMMYDRADDGSLTLAGNFAGGGQGTGQSVIGSQDDMELSADGRFLFVVNAGSNQLSVFEVTADGLNRTEMQDTGGLTPVSVSVNNDLVYVLHLDANMTGSITGFQFNDSDGTLSPIEGSTRQLSEDVKGDEQQSGPDLPAAPVQLEFSPNGNALAVTERFSGPDSEGSILTFTVNGDLLSDTFRTRPATGDSPFGMEFSPTDNNLLVVTQAFINTPGNPIPNASVLSSFSLGGDGSLTTVVATAPSNQTVACWVQFTTDGRFVYVTNTAGISNTITGFGVDGSGNLSRLPTIEEGNEGVTANTGANPVGMGISRDNQFLYAINSGGRQGQGSLSAYQVNADGSLTPLGNAETGVIIDPLPVGVFGIAVL